MRYGKSLVPAPEQSRIDRCALDGTSPGAEDIVSRPARLAPRRNCRAIPAVRVLTSVTRAWTPAHVVPSRVRTIGRDERGPVTKTGRSASASPPGRPFKGRDLMALR